MSPLNNNNRGNNNNNRRRGRGNSRPNGGGGGQQLNRIDSRARGNAPQMLEKFRKLAHDAHLNGDRVQEEYYLQFADHYFRVIADTRVRQEEQRARREDRWQEGGEADRDEVEDVVEYAPDADYAAYDQAQTYTTRREREERQDRGEQQDRSERQDRGEPRRRDREERAPRHEPRAAYRPAPAPAPVAEEESAEPAAANPYEPPENPFVQGNRPTRGLKPRREGRPRRDEQDVRDEAPAGLDPASLPPAIGALPAVEEAAADTKPRRGRPRKKPADGSAGETLESVN